MSSRRKARVFLPLSVTFLLIAAACGRSNDNASTATTPATTAATANTAGVTTTADPCKKEALAATEVGVTATTITVTVMADVGSPLAPGLFQGNLDALNAFALVGDNSLFNPDVSPMEQCVDKAGAATGLPDLAALANDINEQCSKMAYIIQLVAEPCTPRTGVRPLKAMVGPTAWYVKNLEPNLHGIYMVPGDLPTTVQSSTYQITGQATVGVKWDALPKISGADQQPAYTPRIQTAKAANSTFVYDGSNDRAMWTMRKEAKAQGLSSVKVWACSLACYTKAFLATGGADVEGTYLWMQFLPFEEADANPEATAYVQGVGADKVDSFGAQAWQSAVLFKQVVDGIVAKSGPNAITRKAILDGLAATKDFTANGWIGAKDLKGISPCFMIMQVQSGKFARVYPTAKGQLDCNASNVVTVTIDPAEEAKKIS